MLNSPPSPAAPGVEASGESLGKRPRRFRWRRLLLIFFIFVAVVAIGGELVLRYVIGLGDPPLMMNDPLMAYRFQPSQTCHRFHHLIHYNAYSMRSPDEWAQPKSDRQLRVLMIGDSVINGGSLTDQSQLASSLLQPMLSEDLHRPVLVGNASAGGWGPPSELGWVRTFGILNADVVVLVLNSSDYADIPHLPTNIGRAADMPDRKPWCAWTDFLGHYVLPRITHTIFAAEPIPTGNEAAERSAIDWCRASVEQMINFSHQHGARVIVAQHLEREEVNNGLKPGHDYNYGSAQAAHADAIVQLGPAFAAALRDGQSPYRTGDNIHPSAVGQRIMADVLLPMIEKQLSPGAVQTPSTRPVTGRDK